MLNVHFMIEYIILFYGTESTKSDVERYKRSVNAFLAELCKHVFGKMKSRSRSGGRAYLVGIDGLLSVLVLQLFGNVRRQRHLTDTVKHFKYAVAVIGKLGYPVAALGIVHYLGCQNAGKVNLRTDF